jgi:hypothetical protein
MEDRMKQALGATDDEWKVLQPRIEKVRAAQRQNGGGRGMGIIFGGRRGGPSTQGAPDGGQGQNGQGGQNGRGGRGGRGPGGRGPGPDGQTNDSAVAVKVRELQQAVESNAGPDEIKAKMAALRDAKAKAREQVAQAQAELREVLTAKQVGALIVMGVLE